MSYDANSWTSERARLGQLTWKRASEAEITESRRNYHALRLAEHIRKQLANNPPLTDAQRRRLAELFVGDVG